MTNIALHLDRGAYVMAITAPEDGPDLSPRTMSAVGSLLQHYPFLCGASSLASVVLAGADKTMSAWESVRFPDSIILGVTTWFDVGVPLEVGPRERARWMDVMAYHRTKANLASTALSIDGHKLTEVPMRLNVMDNEVTKFWEQCSRTAEAAVRAALEPETQFYNITR